MNKSIAFICATQDERDEYNFAYESVARRAIRGEDDLLWAHEYAQSQVRIVRHEARDREQTARNLRCCDACRAHESHRSQINAMGADCACECVA